MSHPAGEQLRIQAENMIKKGDYLVIKPEWRDAGDEAFTWVARSDEQNGRVDISAVELAHLPLWPVQTVRSARLRRHMLRPAMRRVRQEARS